MKIYMQNYVSINARAANNLKQQLGHLTPFGTDSAAAARISTIEYQSGRYGSPMVYDNIPMTGVEFAESSRPFIKDPHGFIVEISVENLMSLVRLAVIECGQIKDEVIWGREGSSNVLVLVDSDEYRQAWKEGQVLIQKPGDIVKNSKGDVFKYLGAMYAQYIGYIKPTRSPEYDYTNPRFYNMDTPFNHTYKLLCASSPHKVGTILVRKKPMKIDTILKTNQPMDIDDRMYEIEYNHRMKYNNYAWGEAASGTPFYFSKDIRLSQTPFNDKIIVPRF